MYSLRLNLFLHLKCAQWQTDRQTVLIMVKPQTNFIAHISKSADIVIYMGPYSITLTSDVGGKKKETYPGYV